jgi:transposase InsO family protein
MVYETLKEKPNNNLIERYHGTFREYDKVRRGFKSNKTAQLLLDGFRTYYNFIRKHQTLKQLPSEVAKINIPQERNRWLGLLKKSIESGNNEDRRIY